MPIPRRPALAIVNFWVLAAALCLVPGTEATHRQFPPAATAFLLAVGGAWSTWIVAGWRWGGAVLGLVAASMAILYLAADRSLPTAHVLPGFLLAAGCAVAAIALTRASLSRRVRAEDRIFHGLTSYLLIGFAFGTALQRVAILYPGSFRFGGDSGATGVWADFLWLSFSTLTTAGFADIMPVGPWARFTCAAEAVTGVMYPAVFLARLVTSGPDGPDARTPARGGP